MDGHTGKCSDDAPWLSPETSSEAYERGYKRGHADGVRDCDPEIADLRAALAAEKERAERLSGRCAALTDERDALRAVTSRMDGAAHDASERAKVAEEYLDRVRAILGADEDETAEEVAQRVRRRADRAEAALVAR